MVKNISNAEIQRYTRAECAPDEHGYFEEFESLKSVTREQALAKFHLAKAKHLSSYFRLVLEDWNACETEIIEG